MNELEMKQTGTQLIEQSKGFIVKNEQDYKNAAEVCKDIKYRIKKIEEYWKDLKDKAYKAWKDICTKEKELLEPFSKAETDIKAKMTAFQKEKMEEERLLREEQERYRKEEEARLLAAAVKAEEKGATEESEYLIECAEKMHTATFKQPEQVKVAGTAVKTTWKARVINAELVPISIAGAIIRPVDIKALDGLAKASKGNMTIPGVEFYEDINIAVSRG